MAFSKSIILAFVAAASARHFTVKNSCSYTVWPAVFTTPGNAGVHPDVETGWEAPPGSVKEFDVAEGWISGRIWGRTGCDFSTNLPGPTQCVTGGCNGGLLCDPAQGGTGVPPASLAEWTLGTDGVDWYDVSLVDGSNIPMAITASGCPTADCPADLNVDCPDQLAQKDANGNILGCKSACFANLDGHTGGDSPLCCSGSHNTPATCPPGGITYYDHFKNGCPNSYVYAYDESSGTALWTCTKKSDYTLEFCPGSSAPAPPPAPAPAPSPDPPPAPAPSPDPAPPPAPSPDPAPPPAPSPDPAPAPAPSPDPAPAPAPSPDPAPAPAPSPDPPAPAPPSNTCAPPAPSPPAPAPSPDPPAPAPSDPAPAPPSDPAPAPSDPVPAPSDPAPAPGPTDTPAPPQPTSPAPSDPAPGNPPPKNNCPPSRKRALRKKKRALRAAQRKRKLASI